LRIKINLAYQKGAKMSLALNEAKEADIHSNSNTTFQHAPLVQRNYQYCMQNRPMENERGPSSDEKSY
jgi:hypothetical protein